MFSSHKWLSHLERFAGALAAGQPFNGSFTGPRRQMQIAASLNAGYESTRAHNADLRRSLETLQQEASQLRAALLDADRDGDRLAERFDLISRASGEGLWDISVVAGDPAHPDSVVWWSRQMRQLLGYDDEQDFPNRLDSWRSRIHPDDGKRVLAAFAAHLGDVSGTVPYDIEYRLAHKNGGYRWFRAIGTTLRNAHGVPLRIAGSLVDIHEKLEREALLGRSLDRFELVRELLSDGLWDIEIVDGKALNAANTVWWSQQFRRMLGYSDENDFANTLDARQYFCFFIVKRSLDRFRNFVRV